MANFNQSPNDYESEAYNIGIENARPTGDGGISYVNQAGIPVTDYSTQFKGMSNQLRRDSSGGSDPVVSQRDVIGGYNIPAQTSFSYPQAASISQPRSYSDVRGLVNDALVAKPDLSLTDNESVTGIAGLASRAREQAIQPPSATGGGIMDALKSGYNTIREGVDLLGGKVNVQGLPGGGFGINYFRRFNQGGEAQSIDRERSDVAMEAREAYLPQSMLDNITMTDSGIMSTMEGLRESNPEAFAEMMRRNTEKEIERLNMLQYNDDEILAKSGDPVLDRYLIDEAVYRTAVAPGFERTNDMEPYREGSVTGGVTTNARFLSPGYTPRSLVPGDEMSATNVLHETVHDILPRSREGILGAANKEEAAVIGLDLYKAFKAGNKEGFNNALNYLSSSSVGVVLADPFAFDDMRENLTGTIEYLYEQSGNPMNAEQKQALDSEVYSILKKGAQEQFRMQYEGRR